MDFILHFCYGSNMSFDRIKRNCPTAEKVGWGYIKNYEMVFGHYFSKNWNGHVATIISKNNSKVYGGVWKIKLDELPALDLQEGVDKNIYNTIFVPVFCNKGSLTYCYSYQLVTNCGEKKLPSKSYLNTIIKGASEMGVPRHYIDKLEKAPHNGKLSRFEYPDV